MFRSRARVSTGRGRNAEIETMSRAPQRNNIIAGLFLVSGLMLAVTAAFILGDGSRLFTNRSIYFIDFEVAKGIGGVDSGSAVTLGGKKVGRVDAIDFVDRDDGAPGSIRVTAKVDASVRLFTDARAIVRTPLLGTLGSIDITDPGGQAGSSLLESLAVLTGGTAPALSDLIGVDLAMVNEVVVEAREALAAARRVIERVEPEVPTIVTDLRTGTATFNRVLGGFEDNLPPIFERAQGILDTIDQTVADLPTIRQQIKSTLTSADSLFVDTRRVVTSNEEYVGLILRDGAQFFSELNREFSPRVKSLLTRTERTLLSVDESATALNSILVGGAPSIRRTLANLNLASGRAARFVEEISAAPWRLLDSPGNRERQTADLYETARSYAEATARLENASETLDAIVRSAPDTRGLDREEIQALQAQLRTTADRFEEIERRLLTLIQSNTPK